MGRSYRRDLETEMLRERLSRLNEASWCICINESLDFNAVVQTVLDSSRYGGRNGHTQVEQDLLGYQGRQRSGPRRQVGGAQDLSPGDCLTGFPVPLAFQTALDPTGTGKGYHVIRRGSPGPGCAGRLAEDPNSGSTGARPVGRASLFSRLIAHPTPKRPPSDAARRRRSPLL